MPVVGKKYVGTVGTSAVGYCVCVCVRGSLNLLSLSLIMDRVQMSVGSCPVDGPCLRLNRPGEATALSRADPTTLIPGIHPGITTEGHCSKQGLPELASETEIGPCNYQREGTTFVDSIENYLSKGTQLSPANPETFH